MRKSQNETSVIESGVQYFALWLWQPNDLQAGCVLLESVLETQVRTKTIKGSNSAAAFLTF